MSKKITIHLGDLLENDLYGICKVHFLGWANNKQYPLVIGYNILLCGVKYNFNKEEPDIYHVNVKFKKPKYDAKRSEYGDEWCLLKSVDNKKPIVVVCKSEEIPLIFNTIYLAKSI